MKHTRFKRQSATWSAATGLASLGTYKTQALKKAVGDAEHRHAMLASRTRQHTSASALQGSRRRGAQACNAMLTLTYADVCGAPRRVSAYLRPYDTHALKEAVGDLEHSHAMLLAPRGASRGAHTHSRRARIRCVCRAIPRQPRPRRGHASVADASVCRMRVAVVAAVLQTLAARRRRRRRRGVAYSMSKETKNTPKKA
jgi:hypothetical protein